MCDDTVLYCIALTIADCSSNTIIIEAVNSVTV